LHELTSADIGIEVVFYKRVSDKELSLISTYELVAGKQHGSVAIYTCDFQPKTAGVFEYGFRMFPKNPALAHRMEFGLVKWL
jgi:hypothetical protein